MAILFVLTFSATFFVKSKADKVKDKYETAVCASMQGSYTPEQFMQHSADSWQEFYSSHNEALLEKVSPLIQCFCQE